MNKYINKRINENRKTEEEIQIIFQITYIMILTLIATLFVFVTILSEWDLWTVPVTIVCVFSCWIIHFMKAGTIGKRMLYYTIVFIAGIFYYGTNTVAITDIPVLICIVIIVLSLNRDVKLLYLVTGSYGVILLYHIFVTKYLNFETEQIVISRIILGIVCIFCALIISRMIIMHNIRINESQNVIKKELELTKKENEMFLANVSHELRTPINVVNGVSEILLQENLPKELDERIIAIHMAGKRLYSQVTDILDYSELKTGKLKAVQTEYELISVVNDAMSNIEWERMENKLEIAVDIQADIPRVLYGDGMKLKKIITELMRNSIKFTECGGAYLYISKRDESYGINLNIDMYDTGIGMDEIQKNLIYDDALKADAKATRTTAGLGLGLSVIHGMVESMNGYMSVKSEKNFGTHMHISIPQKVRDKKSLIAVEKNSDFRIACYFNREKYTDERVGDYYSSMISHIRDSLGLELHQADSLVALKDIIDNRNITHVFIAEWEYLMDQNFFDSLSKNKFVIVFVGSDFNKQADSNIKVLQKPVYVLSVVNMLKNTTPGNDIVATAQKKNNYNGVRALVVDDDSMNLMVARGVLKTYGIIAETCLSGAQAIEKCMINDYDIIFMDHMMPQMDGITAMHKIREIRNKFYEDIPFVVLTANAVSGAREMFLNEGFDEFVSKPIEMSAMSHSLKKTLKGKEHYHE